MRSSCPLWRLHPAPVSVPFRSHRFQGQPSAGGNPGAPPAHTPEEPAEMVEEELAEEVVPLTQEELDTLKSQATTDDQKKALDAYETITKEGSWTSPNGVTYTEVVGKPDGSWRRMTDAEAEKTLETADPVNDINYFLADAELKGKDWVEYDTVTGKIYYDPYEYAPVLKATVEESRRISEVDEDLSAEEVKELLGEERYRELFGDYTD